MKCLPWSNRITNLILICCILLVTGIQLMFAYPGNHVKIWLVILFLSRQKCYAKQMFVLSSSMKLGPDVHFLSSLLLYSFNQNTLLDFANRTFVMWTPIHWAALAQGSSSAEYISAYMNKVISQNTILHLRSVTVVQLLFV